MTEAEKVKPAIEPVITLGIFLGVVGVTTLLVLFSTGSFLAVIGVWAIFAIILLVLWQTKLVDPKDYELDSLKKSLGIDKTEEEVPEEEEQPSHPLMATEEVFHIADNSFTYEEAGAVCAAYGAVLASHVQIMEAYNNGADWCGYGWTKGGLALYPTQKSTWDELQGEVDVKRRTACGRPGVNGGYFDPSTKFGVNCFGFKPEAGANYALPRPPPGVDMTAFNKAKQAFKDALGSFTLSSHNRNKWTEHFTTYGANIKTTNPFAIGTVFEHLDEFTETGLGDVPEAHSGLRGAAGAAGPVGPMGPAGPQGIPGSATNTGATGPQGERGIPGTAVAKGDKGDPGAKGDKGDQGIAGPQGIPGTAAAAGMPGAPGERGLPGTPGTPGTPGAPGVKGDKGDKGDTGAPGPEGPRGLAGTAAVLPRNPTFDSIKIGRWNIGNEGNPNLLVFRDSAATKDRRHVFWNDASVDIGRTFSSYNH